MADFDYDFREPLVDGALKIERCSPISSRPRPEVGLR